MQRDFLVKDMVARPNQICSGMGLGIMVMDEVYPGFPGDLRNPSGYPFPIQYEIIEGVDIDQIAFGKEKNDEKIIESLIRAAKKLERIGCKAILAECGYFSYYQKVVAEAVNVPVFMSSLLQIPLMQQLIGPNKTVGIFCGNGPGLTPQHLINVGVDLDKTNIKIKGSVDDGKCPAIHRLWTEEFRADLPEAVYEEFGGELVASVKAFVDENPDIGAIILECTGFQIFGRAVQREIDLPVFSWATLMHYAYNVTNHMDFYGTI